MKEILKFLRKNSSFTQSDVAGLLGISRQSYIKYENGEVIPSDEAVKKIAGIYDVNPEIIYRNEIPEFNYNHEESSYKIKDEGNSGSVSEPAVQYGSSAEEFEGIYDGKAVNFIGQIKFPKGQRFKLVPIQESVSEKEIKRREAYGFLMDFIKSRKWADAPEDFDGREEYYKYLEEKFK